MLRKTPIECGVVYGGAWVMEDESLSQLSLSPCPILFIVVVFFDVVKV